MPQFVKVKVKAGASRESIFVQKPHELHIAVKEPAEDNRANERVIELVAAHFHISPKSVHLISGHHRPNKMLKLTAA